MSKVDRGDIEEATVKVEMDLVEPRAGPKGEYRSIVQIQITAMNEEACVPAGFKASQTAHVGPAFARGAFPRWSCLRRI